MAQSGFTPIQLYRTATASAAPSAGNLADGELAINTNDGRLFYKDSGGAVQTIAWRIVPISAGGTGATTASGALTNLGAVAKAGDTMTGALAVVAGTVSAPGLTFSGDTNTGIYSPAADTIAFTEGGVEAMRLDASGNVGIGTAAPTARLNIVDATSQDALRITQTGTGNALVVEDAANPDATPTVITRDGDVIVGGTAAIASYQYSNPQLFVMGGSAGSQKGGQYTLVFSNDAAGPSVELGKSRSTTVGVVGTIVQNGDELGIISFNGDDGTDLRTPGATIRAQVDGTPGTNDMPGRLVFSTTADGASSPTERMRIDNAGRVAINATSNNFHRLVVRENTNSGAVALFGSSSNTVFPGLTFERTRAGTTAVQNGDCIGIIQNNGFDGTSSFGRADVAGFVDGAVSAGSVPTRLSFWTTPTGTTTAQERMRIDATGNVGIGTLAPVTRLHVSAADSTISTLFAGSARGIRLGFSPTISNIEGVDQTGTGSYQPLGVGGSQVIFTISATERMRIDASGNVGIGTASPADRLDVSGGNVRSTGAGSSFARISGGNADGANIQLCRGGSASQNAFISQFQGSLLIKNLDSGATIFTNTTGDVERMRIDASGNVGIGLSNPGVQADINGVMRSATWSLSGTGISGGTAAFAAGTVSTDANWGMYFRAPTGSSAIAEYSFRNSADTERMRIDASGNVGIGTSSPAVNSVTLSRASGYVEYRVQSGANNAYFGLDASSAYLGTLGAQPVQFQTAGTERFRVGPAGQLGIGGANYGTSGQVLTSNGSGAAPSWQNAGGGSAPQLREQLFTSSGSWTAPTGVTRVQVVVIGGGGGGGVSNFPCDAGGGGGGGGTAVGIVTVTSGTTYTVTVGSGGNGAASSNTSGASGGTSSFGGLISATGGGGGSNTPGVNGSNGSGSGGTTRNSSIATATISPFGGPARGAGQGTGSLTWSSTSPFGAGAGGGGHVSGLQGSGGLSGIVYLQWVG